MANLFSENPIIKVVMLKGQDGEEKLINQADGSGLSFWIGTQAEYDAIPEAELIENCVYYITDDTRDDYNTRLNALDTRIDNNTTAIAANTENVATLNTATSPLTELLEAEAVKTTDGTGDVNTDRIIGDNSFNSYTIKAVKKHGTMLISFKGIASGITDSGNNTIWLMNVSDLFYGMDEGTAEQVRKVIQPSGFIVYAPLLQGGGNIYPATSIGAVQIALGGIIWLNFETAPSSGDEIAFSISYPTED